MTTIEGAPLLVLEQLGKDYGSTRALDALDFEVRPGEIVGLLGPNGAGKTTTMKLLLGLLRPSRGSARVGPLDCTTHSRAVKGMLGYSPDEPAFYDFLTGRETVQFVINVRGLEPDATWKRVRVASAGLDFGSAMDQPVGGYSHGTKKKLALVLALVHAPRVLLLDEPTNGLDPPSAAFARAEFRAFAAGGGAVVVSTHLLEMADGLCDRIVVLNRGRVLASGTPSDVRSQAGVSMEASLEEAFLRLVR